MISRAFTWKMHIFDQISVIWNLHSPLWLNFRWVFMTLFNVLRLSSQWRQTKLKEQDGKWWLICQVWAFLSADCRGKWMNYWLCARGARGNQSRHTCMCCLTITRQQSISVAGTGINGSSQFIKSSCNPLLEKRELHPVDKETLWNQKCGRMSDVGRSSEKSDAKNFKELRPSATPKNSFISDHFNANVSAVRYLSGSLCSHSSISLRASGVTKGARTERGTTKKLW